MDKATKDKLVEKAIKLAREYDRVSASLFQRRFLIGYNDASKIMDVLEKKKVVAPSDSTSSPREVYKNK